MNTALSDLGLLIASMEPVVNAGVYVYTSVPHTYDSTGLAVIASMREAEGLTLVLSEDSALARGLPVLFRCAWITLNVHSDLQAVGLTAAFAKALGDAGISCNVVAGAYHDHIFVPVESAGKAEAALRQLQAAS